MDRQPLLIDDPFVKYLLENLHGDGQIFLQNLINCNENLETLTKLIPLLMKDISCYRKTCLIPLIVEKSVEICSKFDKKRTLDQLRERAKELSEATDKEKSQYERSMAYRNKEIDFARKCETSQLFYENKMSEYYKQIKQLENLLVNVGFYDELSEESIKTLAQDNNQLKERIKEVDDKLTYFTFQPDEESLKKTIEGLKNEIEIMNEDLERVIEDYKPLKNQLSKNFLIICTWRSISKEFDVAKVKAIGLLFFYRNQLIVDWLNFLFRERLINNLITMALQSARQLLDELMGRERNLRPTEKTSDAKEDWTHPRICKFFLVYFCPNQLFTNTKADMGPCHKIHDDYIKQCYEEHATRKQKAVYEDEFIRFCQQTLGDVERRIKRARQRLAASQTEKAENLTLGGNSNCLSDEIQEKMQEISDRIEKLLTEIEELGCDGKVEEAQTLMTQVEQLKEERTTLKRGNLSMHWIQARAEMGAAQEKQMEVCDNCGAFLIVNDVQQRVEDHLMGKQHVGYGKLKAALDDLLQRRRADRDIDRKESRKSEIKDESSTHLNGAASIETRSPSRSRTSDSSTRNGSRNRTKSHERSRSRTRSDRDGHHRVKNHDTRHRHDRGHSDRIKDRRHHDRHSNRDNRRSTVSRHNERRRSRSPNNVKRKESTKDQ